MVEAGSVLVCKSGERFNVAATEKGRLTIPELFERRLLEKLPTFAQLAEFPRQAYSGRLVSRTMGAFTLYKPLCEQPTENGKVFIEKRNLFSNIRFGGFTLDALRKAGIDVEKKDVLLTLDAGYSIVDAARNGFDIQYTILVDDMPPEELSKILRKTYDVTTGNTLFRIANGEMQVLNPHQKGKTDDILEKGVLKDGFFFTDYGLPGPFTINGTNGYFGSGWVAEIGVYRGHGYGYALLEK